RSRVPRVGRRTPSRRAPLRPPRHRPDPTWPRCEATLDRKILSELQLVWDNPWTVVGVAALLTAAMFAGAADWPARGAQVGRSTCGDWPFITSSHRGATVCVTAGRTRSWTPQSRRIPERR